MKNFRYTVWKIPSIWRILWVPGIAGHKVIPFILSLSLHHGGTRTQFSYFDILSVKINLLGGGREYCKVNNIRYVWTEGCDSWLNSKTPSGLRHLLFHQSFLPETINKSLQRELGRVSCSGEHGEMFWLEIYVKWSIFSYHPGDSGLNYDEI